MIIWFY